MSILGNGPLIKMERYLHIILLGCTALNLFLEPVWMVRNSITDVQIYLNPGLIDLIKSAFFNGPTAFGYKFKKHYVTSHPDRKEPELTIPVVALGATAVSDAFDHNLTITDMAIQVFCSPL